MMGTKTRTFSPPPHDLSLEDLVPKDHFYRRLEAQLNLQPQYLALLYNNVSWRTRTRESRNHQPSKLRFYSLRIEEIPELEFRLR